MFDDIDMLTTYSIEKDKKVVRIGKHFVAPNNCHSHSNSCYAGSNEYCDKKNYCIDMLG